MVHLSQQQHTFSVLQNYVDIFLIAKVFDYRNDIGMVHHPLQGSFLAALELQNGGGSGSVRQQGVVVVEE